MTWEIAAVYLKPVDMEPRGMGLPAAKSDIHLEADIGMKVPSCLAPVSVLTKV